MLKKIDKNRSENIDINNRRRLIRALEIVLEKKAVEPLNKKPILADILILGVKKNREEVKELIQKRLNMRIEEGMIDEVKNLKEKGMTSERLNDLGLEYRYLNLYLENKLTLDEMKKQLYTKICQFSKRQMT